MVFVEQLGAATPQELEELSEILYLTVHGGASVSFILPFTMDDARAFWEMKLNEGTRRVLVARSKGRIAGTVQLDLGMPPNQKHRGEVAKLLVHPEARRQGIARALMTALEELARREARTLLTLDTRTGDCAEPLYRSLGYRVAGIIPGYARGPITTALEATTLMYKELPPE